jgi:hypothetical protein
MQIPLWVRRAAVMVMLATAAAGCGCTVVAPPPSGPPPSRAGLIVGDSNTLDNSWARQLGSGCRPAVWAWGGVGVFVGAYGSREVTHVTAEIMARRPSAHVVIMLGTNDVLKQHPTPSVVELNRVSAKFLAAGASSVRWATIPPLGDAKPAAQRRQIDAWNQQVLRTANAVDLRSALGSYLDPGEHVGDGVHLSPSGHRALAKTAARTSIC